MFSLRKLFHFTYIISIYSTEISWHIRTSLNMSSASLFLGMSLYFFHMLKSNGLLQELNEVSFNE